MPYYKKVVDGKVVAKKLAMSADETWEEIVGDPGLVEVYQEPVLTYSPDTMISWAMAQLFTEALIPHFASFLDFANKATDASAANFRAYATATGLSETAETIIEKAIELGANIDA